MAREHHGNRNDKAHQHLFHSVHTDIILHTIPFEFCGHWFAVRSPKARLFRSSIGALEGTESFDAPYVLMIFRPARRFLTGPRPPVILAARVLAAVIRPPLLFFAIYVVLC